MAHTTLAVQTVERVRREQVDSPVCGVCGVYMYSVCIEFSSFEALVAYTVAPLENGYHNIESIEAIFKQF